MFLLLSHPMQHIHNTNDDDDDDSDEVVVVVVNGDNVAVFVVVCFKLISQQKPINDLLQYGYIFLMESMI